jgi:hypothetical protein
LQLRRLGGGRRQGTITGAKFHSFTSEDPAKNNVLDIRNYRGQIAIGRCA